MVSVQFSRSVVSDSLWPHESQHARPSCPSPTPGVHSDSRPSSQWCHPAISSSVIPFSSCPHYLPASESFPMSQLFAWGGQSIGVSASASVLPMNTQNWFPLGWTGWISLQSKGLSRVFSNTTVQKHQFFSAQLSSQSYGLALSLSCIFFYLTTYLLFQKPQSCFWMFLTDSSAQKAVTGLPICCPLNPPFQQQQDTVSLLTPYPFRRGIFNWEPFMITTLFVLQR